MMRNNETFLFTLLPCKGTQKVIKLVYHNSIYWDLIKCLRWYSMLLCGIEQSYKTSLTWFSIHYIRVIFTSNFHACAHHLCTFTLSVCMLILQGFQGINSVCFGISIPNFICTLSIPLSRSLLILQFENQMCFSQTHACTWTKLLQRRGQWAFQLKFSGQMLIDLLYIDGLVQERCNPSALSMELRLSCTNSSIYRPTQILISNNMSWC